MNLDELRRSLVLDKELRIDEVLFISDETIAELIDEFMPDGTFNCRKSNCSIQNCQSRCSYHYWNNHGLLTKELMELLAKKIGADAAVFGRTGFIHDIDYLRYPHDRGDNKNAHPIPLVKKMIEKNIHPEICLAVLEHAPYLKLTNDKRSKLSYALTACEELATLLSVKNNSAYVSELSIEAKELAGSIYNNPKYLIDINIDLKPRVLSSPQKCINYPLSIVLN